MVEQAVRRAEAADESAWRHEAFAWGCLGIYALFCVFLWVEPLWRPDWDSALYILTGRSLAAGEGYTYLGEAFALRPVGFSWLLSFLVGEEGPPGETLQRFMLVCAAGAVLTIFLVLRRAHGVIVALAVALLTGTSPLFVGRFNYVLSELPYMIAVFGALALLQSSFQGSGRWWVRSLAGAACLVAATYLRTVALVALPGILLVALRHRGQDGIGLRVLLPLLTVGLAVTPWFVYAHGAAEEATTLRRQLMLSSYTTAILHERPGDPESPRVSVAELWSRVQRNGSGLAKDASRSLSVYRRRQAELTPAELRRAPDTPFNNVTKGIVAVVLLTGFALTAWRKGGLFEWFALANVLVILSYFTYASRLTLPLVPFFYLYLLTLPLQFRRLRFGPSGRGLTLGLALVLLAANAWSFADNRGASPRTRTRWEDVRTIAAWVEENAPAEAVVLARQGPMIAVLTGRTTYSYRFYQNPALLDEYGIEFAIFFAEGGVALEHEARSRAVRSAELSTSFRAVAYELRR